MQSIHMLLKRCESVQPYERYVLPTNIFQSFIILIICMTSFIIVSPEHHNTHTRLAANKRTMDGSPFITWPFRIQKVGGNADTACVDFRMLAKQYHRRLPTFILHQKSFLCRHSIFLATSIFHAETRMYPQNLEFFAHNGNECKQIGYLLWQKWSRRKWMHAHTAHCSKEICVKKNSSAEID